MDFVVDASIAAAWVLEDEQNDLADHVIDLRIVKTATAPHLWALEIANILLVAERRGRIDVTRRKMMAEAVQNLGVPSTDFPPLTPPISISNWLSASDASGYS